MLQSFKVLHPAFSHSQLTVSILIQIQIRLKHTSCPCLAQAGLLNLVGFRAKMASLRNKLDHCGLICDS